MDRGRGHRRRGCEHLGLRIGGGKRPQAADVRWEESVSGLVVGQPACDLPIGSRGRQRPLLAARRRNWHTRAPDESRSRYRAHSGLVFAGCRPASVQYHERFDVITASALFKTREITSFGGVESVDLPGSAFSPDGRWVAYTVREGATPAIYVQPFPATGAKYQIAPSTIHPVWTRDGKEIIGMTRGRPIAVGVTTQPRFELRGAVEFPRTFLDGGGATVRSFDVMPDGQHLLAIPFPESS